MDFRLGAVSRVLRLDGVEHGGDQPAEGGIHLHHGPVVLAGGGAGSVRRDAAHLLLVRHFDLWRPTLDSHFDCLTAVAGGGHRIRGAEPADPILDHAGAGAAQRLRRRQLRLEHGQHQFLFSAVTKGIRAGDQRRAGQPRRVGDATGGAVRHHYRAVRRLRRTAAAGGPRRARDLAMAAERRLHLGAVHPAADGAVLVRDERRRQRQGVVQVDGGDLPAQAHLADELALPRHLRLVHRVFRRFSPVDQDAVSERQRRRVRVSRPAGRVAGPSRRRLPRRQALRCLRDAVEFHRHGRSSAQRDPVPAARRQRRQLLGVLRVVHGPVHGDRGRQRLDLSHGAADVPHHPPSADRPPAGVAPTCRCPGQQRGGCGARVHFGRGCLRRILHPDELRSGDGGGWQPGCRFFWFRRVLFNLHCSDLVVLLASRR